MIVRTILNVSQSIKIRKQNEPFRRIMWILKFYEIRLFSTAVLATFIISWLNSEKDEGSLHVIRGKCGNCYFVHLLGKATILELRYHTSFK